MSLNIAICDDEKTEVEYLSRLLYEWADAANVKVILSAYDSAEAFLFAYDEDKSIDILLLDIQMNGLDGITLAKQLRADGEELQIVFITGFPDFIAEGYDVSALHYLMKPVSKEKLTSVLDKALMLIRKADESVLIDAQSGKMRIYLRDIHYVEAFAHTSALYTKTGLIEAKYSISELEAMLGKDFCRVHRSYLAGLRYIRKITKSEILMDNGKTIPIARRRYDTVNQAFIRYHKGDR